MLRVWDPNLSGDLATTSPPTLCSRHYVHTPTDTHAQPTPPPRPCCRHGSHKKHFHVLATSSVRVRRFRRHCRDMEVVFCGFHVGAALPYHPPMWPHKPVTSEAQQVPEHARGQEPLLWFLPFATPHCCGVAWSEQEGPSDPSAIHSLSKNTQTMLASPGSTSW